MYWYSAGHRCKRTQMYRPMCIKDIVPVHSSNTSGSFRVTSWRDASISIQLILDWNAHYTLSGGKRSDYDNTSVDVNESKYMEFESCIDFLSWDRDFFLGIPFLRVAFLFFLGTGNVYQWSTLKLINRYCTLLDSKRSDANDDGSGETEPAFIINCNGKNWRKVLDTGDAYVRVTGRRDRLTPCRSAY